MRNISDILREEREKKGLSLDDVVAALKIRKNFIINIEKGDFEPLPSESYAMGFVKNYADYLGISSTRAAALFRREYEAKQIEVIPKFRKTSRLPGKRLFSRSAKGYVVTAIIIVAVVYIAFQFSFLFTGPKLSLKTPRNGSVVASGVVFVTGKTDPYATVTVNGENVYVDLSGTFRKTLYVYHETEKITVVAHNRYGKETKKEVEVQVK